MRSLAVVLAAVLWASNAMAQGPAAPPAEGRDRSYSFLLLDSPLPPLTMRGLDQDYLSAYRLFADTANRHLSPFVSYLVQTTSSFFLLKTWSHEEGHRTVLREEGISSGNRSFFFMSRAGYVDGVTDATLKRLRDTRFPTFIRLHTAGFESDYMLATREETLLSFEGERYGNVAVDYLFRKGALIAYFTEGYFERDTDDAEEPDELKRDVVGNDLYGAIRHLFRPTMEFRRYTRYDELTAQEHRYLRRVQRRTFLNLANLNVIGKRNFSITDDLKANVGLGHCMGPFGDFIDEKIWVSHGRDLSVSAYVREFENRDHWFWGAGAGVVDYPVTRRLKMSGTVHFWRQPVGLSFTSGTAESGGAVDVWGSYDLVAGRNGRRLRSVAAEAGLICKTAGFLPEETVLERNLGLRVGLRIGLQAR